MRAANTRQLPVRTCSRTEKIIRQKLVYKFNSGLSCGVVLPRELRRTSNLKVAGVTPA